MKHPIQDWQEALAKVITDPEELCRELNLDRRALDPFISRNNQFPLRVPRGFVARMEKGNPRDPLLLQVLPLTQEYEATSGFSSDPLQEKNSNPIPGLLHKYHGRVLLITTGACAVHCRYCFRRFFPYEDQAQSQQGWQTALDYIANDASIEEVILSGGDPLVFKDNILSHLIQKIAAIPHVKILRFHTRLPIVLPERITESFIALITNVRLKIVCIIHCNHPKEIDENVKRALFALRKAGVTLLNQGVLLKDINDNAETLIQLSQTLFDAGVLPYYLYALDRVQGSAHFEVDLEKARILMKTMTEKLPGYLIPKFVQEIAGEAAKTAV